MRLAIVVLFAAAAGAEDFVIFREPGADPREQLTRHLNSIAFQQLDERARAIAAIKTPAAAGERQALVKEKILRLIGGLPDHRGPLHVKQFGTIDGGDYRIEKITYDSLPGFHVTANVYVPNRGSPPFPAILMPVGHGRDGKGGSQQVAIGLALKGFIALAFDPIGQGERLQHYDPESGASKVGGPTDEHSHANAQTMLIGDSVARYRIWDGMRGIDYLLTRKDVDGSRIGCTGCSGGGTLTTYISALDDRVKAAAPACYVTSWRELLIKLGPQDGEQVFPDFLREQLDIADFIELFAPKPWLIVSTIHDFFPLEGARQSYEEARQWYALYGAQDRIAWHVGPGGHGWPKPSREAIYEWFDRWLKDGKGDPREPEYRLNEPDQLLVTQTGQVADSLGGQTVYSINRARAAKLMPSAIPQAASLANLVRETARIEAEPGARAPKVTVHRSVFRTGYRIDLVSLETAPGVHLPGMIAVPDGEGAKPAVLMAHPLPKSDLAAPGGDFDLLAGSGRVVLAIAPRGVPETATVSRSVLGNYGAAMRAAVVGKTIVGLRADDIIRAVNYLAARPDVAARKHGITAFAQGYLSSPLLHAAVLDQRIGEVVVQDALWSYRAAVERPLNRALYDSAVPGVLRSYDLDHLILALSPARVTVLNPVDPAGNPLRLEPLRKQFGNAKHVRIRYRGRRDPLSNYLYGGKS